MCWISERALRPGSGAPAQARRFVVKQLAAALATHGTEVQTIALAELLVSELVSNAVKAAAHAMTVHVAVHHRWVQLAVGDDAAGEPRLADPGPSDVGGRGLLIVNRLAIQWGAHCGGENGKTVWCRLDLPEYTTAHLDCHVRALHPSKVPADTP